jgi:hypothetical protein
MADYSDDFEEGGAAGGGSAAADPGLRDPRLAAQVTSLRRENARLRRELALLGETDRATALREELVARDNEIRALKGENRSLQRIQREQAKALTNLANGMCGVPDRQPSSSCHFSHVSLYSLFCLALSGRHSKTGRSRADPDMLFIFFWFCFCFFCFLFFIGLVFSFPSLDLTWISPSAIYIYIPRLSPRLASRRRDSARDQAIL